jgi:hypothetical protein
VPNWRTVLAASYEIRVSVNNASILLSTGLTRPNIRSDGQQPFRYFRGLYQILVLIPKMDSGILSRATTAGAGLPSRTASMLSSASTPVAVLISIVAAPMCSSRNVFFSDRYPGLSGCGSCAARSKPRHVQRPDC